MKTIEAAASNISSNALCAANCMETEYGATTKAPVNTACRGYRAKLLGARALIFACLLPD